MKIWEKYQGVRIKTKKIINKVRSKAFDEFYEALGTKNEKWQIYKIAKGKGKENKRFSLSEMH